MVLPTSSPHRLGLLAGFAGPSQSSRYFPWGGGGGGGGGGGEGGLPITSALFVA